MAQNSSSSNGNGAAATNPASGGSAAGAAAAAVPAPTHPMLIRPAELANLIYVTSKLQQQRPQLLAAAAAGLQLDLYACSTVELNRLIWGLASARLNPGDAWMLGFCKAAQAKFGECSNSQLSTLVYGAARLGYRPPDVWIAAWLEVSLPLLGRMNAQQLANSAWGLSCFRCVLVHGGCGGEGVMVVVERAFEEAACVVLLANSPPRARRPTHLPTRMLLSLPHRLCSPSSPPPPSAAAVVAAAVAAAGSKPHPAGLMPFMLPAQPP